MKAILVNCVPGQLGRLLVDFPANSTEDNKLHTHPASDRCVTVIKGSGDFICYRDKKVQKFPLVPGVRVWMPRGILHTFKSGNEGLLVESLHNPFIPLDHPKCLIYPKLAIE
jgi:quercetin dioxygenase-like cupin family protein